MKYCMTAILAFCFYASALGMQETCTHAGFQYRGRTSFLSVKADGRRYSCSCQSSSSLYNSFCSQINCFLISGPTEASPPTINSNDPEDELPIEGEVPSLNTSQTAVLTSTSDSSDLIPIFIPANDFSLHGEHCMDEESNKMFRVGDTFYRLIPNDRIRKKCECRIASGTAEIVCSDAPCKLRDPPTSTPNTGGSNYGECYDPWQARVVPNGEVYNRTRPMDDHSDITGEYSCTCLDGSIICDALDIPCCNMETGDFVERGSRFITKLGRMVLDCMCHRERARFSDCKIVSPTSNPRRKYPYSQYPEARCSDGYNPGRSYSVGQSWIQNRGNSGNWNCTCSQHGYTLRTRCAMNSNGYIGTGLVPRRYEQSRYTQSRYVSPVRRPSIGQRRYRPSVPVQRPVRIYSGSYHGNTGK